MKVVFSDMHYYKLFEVIFDECNMYLCAYGSKRDAVYRVALMQP